MGSAEFAEWLAYERIDPWSGEREDLRVAMMTASIINTIRGMVGRGAKYASIDDFMLDFEPRKPVDVDQEADAIMAMLTRAAENG